MNPQRYIFCAAISVAIHSVYVFANEQEMTLALRSSQHTSTLNIQMIAPQSSQQKIQQQAITEPVNKTEKTAEPVTQEPKKKPITKANQDPQPVIKKQAVEKTQVVEKRQQEEIEKIAKAEQKQHNKQVDKAQQNTEKPVAKESIDKQPKKQQKTPEASNPNKHETEISSDSNLPIVLSKPNFKAKPSPIDYPRLAQRRNLQGEAIIEVWLDEKGEQIKQTIIHSSGHKLLDSAALKSISDWQFQGHHNGQQYIASRVQIPVTFKLD